MPNLWMCRASIALVWLYQGLWCKILGRIPRHEAVLASVPFLSARAAHAALLLLGLFECAIAVWALSGKRPREAAWCQTLLLIVMNSGGVLWASRIIPDPTGMLLQNFAFALLIWTTAGEYAARA